MKQRTTISIIAALTACAILSACGEDKKTGFLMDTFKRAPIADAGADQAAYLTSGSSGSSYLDGTGSYNPDGDALAYSWEVVYQPAGSTVSFADPAAVTTLFTFDAIGTYEIKLTVSYGLRAASDLVTVHVADNQGPTADAGPDLEAGLGDLVALDGSGSADPENSPLTYTWTQITGPTIGTGTLTGAAPTFTAPSEVCTLVFDLQVNDGGGNSLPDRVYVFVMEKAGTGMYVSSLLGDDANEGTDRSAPKKTIRAAVTAARASGFDLYVSDGDYAESVALANRVSIYGGFLHGTWERDRASYQTSIQGGTIALEGNGVGEVVIDGLTITSANAIIPGESSCGVHLKYSSVTLKDCIITAGNGAGGIDGTDVAVRAANGTAGSAGGWGSSDRYSEDPVTIGVGGAGGASDIGRSGGWGGTGGFGEVYAGQPGGEGRIGTPGGSGGAMGVHRGHDGGNGSNGADGADGAGGSSGIVKNSLWVSSSGVDGTDGIPGNGGGGGGAGGAGGTGGGGGAGGGGSFGLFLSESSVTVENCVITSGSGGDGGAGGPSFAIYKYGLLSIIYLNGNTLTCGAGGSGGAGGGSGGGAGDPGEADLYPGASD